MNEMERKVSDYIDRLNEERKPDEDEQASEELVELYQTIRLVRSLKEPAMPGPDYPMKLVQSVADQLPRRHRPKSKWSWILGVAGVALFVLLLNFTIPLGNTNVVHAMEKAFRNVQAYHGTLEIVETNANGESAKQAKLEVWADKEGRYYIQGLEGPNKDLVTVNNGQRKWQIQSGPKQVHLFPAFPDAYRFQFELGNEIQEVRNASSATEVGEDTVAGRRTTILEVTPKGGLPYRIWIDKETKLPLQKQKALYHAIQYNITYTQIEFTNAIPEQLIAYRLPEGFKEIDTNPEQFVTDLNEAQGVVGYAPRTPELIPTGYFQDRFSVIPDKHLVKIYYSAPTKNYRVLLEQSPLTGELKPVPNAIIGRMNNGIVEIQAPRAEDSGTSSVRWRQDGEEYSVMGDAPLGDLLYFAKGIMNGTLEIPSENETAKPQVQVPYDLTIETNDQKSVDSGSSPWKLDPIYAAQVFVSLQMSPQGITGKYPIQMEDLAIVNNNGKEAVVTVSDESSPIKKVYLQRLVRQDSTGIWTVVGYDPR